MADKIRFAGQVQNKGTQLAVLTTEIKTLFEAYFDRGYQSGTQTAITNEELEAAALTITAEQIAAFITLAENLPKFIDYDGNNAPFLSNYGTVLNQIRTDI